MFGPSGLQLCLLLSVFKCVCSISSSTYDVADAVQGPLLLSAAAFSDALASLSRWFYLSVLTKLFTLMLVLYYIMVSLILHLTSISMKFSSLNHSPCLRSYPLFTTLLYAQYTDTLLFFLCLSMAFSVSFCISSSIPSKSQSLKPVTQLEGEGLLHCMVF